jgi:hypothetical protein
MLIYCWLEMDNSSSHLPAFFPLIGKPTLTTRNLLSQASSARTPTVRIHAVGAFL